MWEGCKRVVVTKDQIIDSLEKHRAQLYFGMWAFGVAYDDGNDKQYVTKNTRTCGVCAIGAVVHDVLQRDGIESPIASVVEVVANTNASAWGFARYEQSDAELTTGRWWRMLSNQFESRGEAIDDLAGEEAEKIDALRAQSTDVDAVIDYVKRMLPEELVLHVPTDLT